VRKDGTGTPLRDALIEIWQADGSGVFPGREGSDPNFTGFGRTAGDMETGEFRFETVKPGQVLYPDGRPQAPHITFWIVARGINIRACISSTSTFKGRKRQSFSIFDRVSRFR